MLVRQASRCDIPECVSLIIEFLVEPLDGTGFVLDPTSIAVFIESVLTSPNACGLVAEEDGVICGGIIGQVTPWAFNQRLMVLQELGWFVRRESRDSHPFLGPRLFRRLLQWGRDRGAYHIMTSSTVRPESARVSQFYSKLGLKHTDSYWLGVFS